MSENLNYLLQDSVNLPEFSKVKNSDMKDAVVQQISKCKEVIEETLKIIESKDSFSFDDLVEPISKADDKLSRIWSIISHLNSVMNSDELRKVHDECLPFLSEYGTFVGQHKGLYNAYKKLADSKSYNDFNQAQKQTLKHVLRDFVLSGISLTEDKQKKYGEIIARLSELSSNFSNNVMDSVLNWHKHIIDENKLKGLPKLTIETAKKTAKEKGLDGYVFTLDYPSYSSVMMYADDRDLRKEMYEAYVTRASNLGPNANKWDNHNNIVEILKLRHDLAILLGFNNYAEYSIETKMANTTEEVSKFLNDLAIRCKNQGDSEYKELSLYAKEKYNCDSLEAWDRTYYSEKLKQEKYNVSEEELREFFPLDTVLKGLFEIVHRLFDINISQKKSVDVWHQDVRYFEVFDKNNELCGSFYLDPYARPHKRGGAWMDECLSRKVIENGVIRKPVAYLVCNFNPPVNDNEPSLLTQDEVTTLFHEFGHGLNLILTKIDVDAVSGINGVAWDAVELPSQFMENWFWQEEALKLISSHIKTKLPLPKSKLDQMIKAKNFQSAMFILRQLEFGIMDFNLHLHFDTNNPDNIKSVIDSTRKLVSVANVTEYNKFENSFSHIFSGGYAAGYYSYLWAELLSSDSFSRFEEEGIFNNDVGNDFKKFILEVGGSVDSMEMFENFRGRKPSINALLRHNGIK